MYSDAGGTKVLPVSCSFGKGKMMIKNIIFDVGKVLVKWEPERAMRELGMSEETIAAVMAATVNSKEWDETDRGVWSNEEILAAFIGKAPEYETEIRKFWGNLDLAVRPFSYVKDWITELKEQGYHLYILSNYGEWTYQKTKEALSFEQKMDGALFSYRVKCIKPDQKIYQTLLQMFGLKAEECVFLDDREENIEGARQAGIHGIVFNGYEEAKKSLEELLRQD